MKWDNIKMTSISYEHRSRNASVDNHYLVATLRTPGQQGDVDVLDEGDVAVGLLDDLVLKWADSSGSALVEGKERVLVASMVTS